MQNDNSKFKKGFKAGLYSAAIIIKNQLIRSGTSVLANYVEVGASSSRREFTNFFQHSLKSANESMIWLNLLKDTDSGDKETITILLKELDEIAKIIASSIISLKGKR